MGKIVVGIAGWRYQPWRGVFYPAGLSQDRELAFASRALQSIELNGSFYALQKPASYAAWHAATPPGFVFSVKGNRYITHVKRLRDIDAPLANVLASGVFELGAKLGPFLWQFPPNFRFEPDSMAHFLSLLPHDTDQGLALARQHEPRMQGKVALQVDKKRKLRHAIEIRHESFVDPAFIALLRKYKVALVVADTAGKWPYYEDITADFMYLRLHGDKQLYASGYTEAALARWAARLKAWRAGTEPDDARHMSGSPAPRRASRDVFCYFDDDIKVHAPFDAMRLIAMLNES